MTGHHDVVVVGGGVMGRAAAWHLAENGVDVLVIEQQGADVPGGSSHGASRGLRYSYEDPAYARLAMHAETWWRYAERCAGVELLRMTGGLDIGYPGTPTYDRTVRTVRDLGLDHELLSARDVAARFPGFELRPGMQAIHQPDAGLISAQRAMSAFLRLAAASGAVFAFDTTVVTVEPATRRGDPFRLACRSVEEHTVTCDRLVLCAGPWTGALLARSFAVRLPLSVLQCEPVYVESSSSPAPEVLFYLHPDADVPDGIYVQPQPADFLDAGDTVARLKVGRHGGLLLESPAQMVRGRSVEDHAALLARLDVLPGFAGSGVAGSDTCFYTMTPDDGFLLDFVDPGRRVVLAAGFSGHGFKFAPVIGRAVAEMLLDAQTAYEVAGMRIDRLRA